MVLAESCPREKTENALCPEYYTALKTDEPVIGGIYMVNSETAGINMAKSIVNPAGETIGVLMLLLLPENTLYELLANHTSLGETGETYLVGADTTMLTPSRNHLHPQPLTHKMPTEGVKNCLSGIDSVGIYQNISGNKVVGAYVWIPEQKWALLAEMTAKEAFSPLYRVGMEFLLVLGIGLGLVFGVSIYISRRLTQPLYNLAEASEAVAKGNLDIQINADSNDEVGQLALQFNYMVKSLRASQRKLEHSHRELVQAEKLAAVGRLVASIVHEMRSPLSAIKMNIRIIQKKGSFSGLEKEHLGIAADQTGRLEKMLNELLEYSKPVKPKYCEFDITETMNRIISDQSELLMRKNIEVIRQYPVQKPIMMESDPDLMTRIIDNIITNAINASGLGQPLEIWLEGGEIIIIRIKDHGIGMTDKASSRLFEPFFTTRENGIGLGMSNVKKFIDVLDGTVEVQSKENLGTSITFTFSRKISNAEDIDNR